MNTGAIINCTDGSLIRWEEMVLFSTISTLKKNISLILMTTVTEGKSPLIILADDDMDDRETFVEAINLIAPHVKVAIEPDGVELMKTLGSPNSPVPDLLFLDLNMPRKNGFECLEEIRKIERYKSVPVVVYSTSSNPDFINSSYSKGANLYAVKPQSFKAIKQLLLKILNLKVANYFPQPPKSEFVLRLD